MLLTVFIILLCCFVAMPQWLMIFGIVIASLSLLIDGIKLVCKIVGWSRLF